LFPLIMNSVAFSEYYVCDNQHKYSQNTNTESDPNTSFHFKSVLFIYLFNQNNDKACNDQKIGQISLFFIQLFSISNLIECQFFQNSNQSQSMNEFYVWVGKS
jgi:hypothetical protein